MRRFFIGYNTNGLANHTFPDACRLLQKYGYEGIAITLDHDLLMRTDDDRLEFRVPPAEIARVAKSHGLRCVVETGARYLLDPFRKHEPTFFDDDEKRRALRQAYYFRAIELAAETESTCVSLWTGNLSEEVATLDELNEIETFKKYLKIFCASLIPVMDYARKLGVRVAMEPEPGMLLETAGEYGILLEVLEEMDARAAAELYLTLDTGHLIYNDEPIRQTFYKYRDRLVNVHLDDAVRRRWSKGKRIPHEHLLLGDGWMDVRQMWAGLVKSAQFSGSLCVELSRHSHCAAETVRETREFIRKVWDI